MDSKPATKSRIPIPTRKKEQTSDDPTPQSNKEQTKELETKNNIVERKTARSELNVKTKISSEVQAVKKNVEKLTSSEKTCTLKNFKPKTQNKKVSPKEIETGMVNVMKNPKTQKCKTIFKLGGKKVNPGSKQVNGTFNTPITNVKKETKKEDPKSLTVPKKPTVAKCRVSKLRRSRTEQEPKLGKTGSSSTHPPQKITPDERPRNVNKDKEIVKNSDLSGNEACAILENNALLKETSADAKKTSESVRVHKILPLEKKEPKPTDSQLKPFRRSKTFQVFDLVPKLTRATKVNTQSTDNNTIDLEAGKVSCIESENHQNHVLGENGIKEVQAESKKTPGHSESVTVPRIQPLERKATKPNSSQLNPLRRSKTFQVFDLVPKVTTLTHSTDNTIDLEAGKVPSVELEDHQSHMLGENGIKEVHLTPKRQLPHGGISFHLQRAKKAQAMVFNTQSEK